MLCFFNIVGNISDKEIEDWNRLTNNAPLPDRELDLPCVPLPDESWEFDYTFGENIVQISGKVEYRVLIDDRNNVKSKRKKVFYWIETKDIEVWLLDKSEYNL